MLLSVWTGVWLQPVAAADTGSRAAGSGRPEQSLPSGHRVADSAAADRSLWSECQHVGGVP